MTVLKTIFALACTFGCSYNAFQITSSYLAYDVIAESWFFSTDVITPPLINLCIMKNYKDGSNRTKKFNTSREFFEGSLNFSAMTKKVVVTQRGHESLRIPENDIPRFEKHNVISYTAYEYSCYAINLTIYNGTQLAYTSAYIKSLDDRSLIAFAINATSCHREDFCQLMISNYRSVHTLSIYARIKGGHHKFVEYIEQQLFLKPKPYATKCRDYQRQGFESQEDCIVKCLKAKCLKEFGGVTSRLNIFSHENYKFVNKIIRDDMQSDCETLCFEIACELDAFTVSVVTNAYGNGFNTYITVSLPLAHKIKVNYLPKVEFWDFLTLFGSVFGLWFGLSTFGLIEYCLKFNCKALL